MTSYELILGEAELADAVLQTEIPKLSVVPASEDLSGAEFELIEPRAPRVSAEPGDSQPGARL